MAISMNEILMGRAKYQDLPKEYQANLITLLERISRVRDAYGKAMTVTSGYRPPELNAKLANSGKNSWHLKCAAVDIADTDCKLWTWTMQNLQLCKDVGLWLEDKRWTPNWVHYQIFAPASKKRIFVPSTKPPINPKIWDGKYDAKFD